MNCNWQLKGQGAANLVFGYCGDDPKLHGHVLRIRKSSAHMVSDIDRLLWGSVLDIATGHSIHLELEYIKTFMAPLLGHEYVFPGVHVPIPGELHSLMNFDAGANLQAGSSTSSSLPALVLPDHTTFHSKVAQGYIGVGPAICLEIKPKWGLDPRQAHCRQPNSSKDGRNSPAPKHPDGRYVEDANSVSSPEEQSVEVDGALTNQVSAEGVLVNVDLRQHYPRFMLHMLYKHVKHGVPISLYNPLDLFSGQLDRMEAAVHCLIKSPSNNFYVFKDGIRIYGATSIKAATTVGANISHLKHEGAADCNSLEQLEVELQGFFVTGAVYGRDENHGDDGGDGVAGMPPADAVTTTATATTVAIVVMSPAAATATAAATTVTALSSSSLSSSSSSSTTTTATMSTETESATASVGSVVHDVGESAGPGATVPIARCCIGTAGLDAQKPQTLDYGHRGQPADQKEFVVKSLARLTALALQREGLLNRVQQVQALDGLGPEGALRLYDQLTRELQGTADVTGAAEQVLDSGVSGSPAADALEALRHYLMSATAKDCGIMVTLQRAVPSSSSSSSSSSSLTTIEAITKETITMDTATTTGAATITTTMETMTSAVLPVESCDCGASEKNDGSGISRREQQPSLEAGTRTCCGTSTSTIPSPSIISGNGCDIFSKKQDYHHHHPLIRVLEDPHSGATYMYKVALVDLDVKAVSKIPKHVELERSLVACANANQELLWALAQQMGWPCHSPDLGKNDFNDTGGDGDGDGDGDGCGCDP